MTANDESSFTTEADAGPRFRRTLIRVMAVQVISLVLLWALQHHYLV